MCLFQAIQESDLSEHEKTTLTGIYYLCYLIFQVTEIHPSAMRISIRVAMDLPTIVIPKHSKSPDLFMFQFRTFSIDNSLKKTALENGKEQDWNIFRAHLKEMQVSRYVLEVSRYVLDVSLH